MNGQQKPHILGQQPQQQQEAANAAVAQQLFRMSSEIYTRAAASTLTLKSNEVWPAGAASAYFRQLAQYSHSAAKAYFEGLNLAKFNDHPAKKDGIRCFVLDINPLKVQDDSGQEHSPVEGVGPNIRVGGHGTLRDGKFHADQ